MCCYRSHRTGICFGYSFAHITSFVLNITVPVACIRTLKHIVSSRVLYIASFTRKVQRIFSGCKADRFGYTHKRPKHMDELRITFVFFIFIFSCHIVLHRALLLWGRETMHTLWCYAAGAIMLCVLWRFGLLAYPLSTLIFYTLLSAGMCVLYMSFFLDAQTPAAIIVDAFTFRKTQDMRSIVALFNKHHVFEKRIDNLVSFGLVKKRNMRYMVTRRGIWIAAMIRWYHVIFHRPAGG
jgi:predicted transcriptional regulator